MSGRQPSLNKVTRDFFLSAEFKKLQRTAGGRLQMKSSASRVVHKNSFLAQYDLSEIYPSLSAVESSYIIRTLIMSETEIPYSYSTPKRVPFLLF